MQHVSLVRALTHSRCPISVCGWTDSCSSLCSEICWMAEDHLQGTPPPCRNFTAVKFTWSMMSSSLSVSLAVTPHVLRSDVMPMPALSHLTGANLKTS